MRTILSQCVAGLQDVALRALQQDLSGVQPVHVEEGMIVYRTGDSVARLRALPYLNNSFQVLQSIPAAGSMDRVLAAVVDDRAVDTALRGGTNERERSFRVFLSDENELVSGAPALVSRLRRKIEDATRLKFQPARADVQFWLIRRRSGRAFFARRLTQRARTEKDLAQGELRPELAHLLCRLSEPGAEDVFLDPFAGTGSIPFARIQYPYGLVYAFDQDEGAVAFMKDRLKALPANEKHRARKLIVKQADALALDRIQDGFVDRVVTDPPWGLFRELPDVDAFYAAALRELARVTRPGGIVVLLTAQKELTGSLLAQPGHALAEEERYDLLVAGKKAAVFKLRRAA
ncbi:MAG TPA: RsmD family RNA methyltransferase [Longimicrobium sp.]